MGSDEPIIETNSDHGDSEEEVLSSRTSSHEGTAKVGMAPSPARLKPPPVALQVLPLGVNARLRWGQLHRNYQLKRPLGSSCTFKQAEKDDLLGVVLVQNNPYKLTRTKRI